MRKFLKIVCTLFALGFGDDALPIDVYNEKLYYITFDRVNLGIGTSRSSCGDDYYYLDFQETNNTFYHRDGKNLNSGNFTTSSSITSSVMPSTLRMQGKAGDEPNASDCTSKVAETGYTKGMNPVNLQLSAFYKKGVCARSIDATYRVTVTDYAEIVKISMTSGSACEDTPITLSIGPYYNGNGSARLLIWSKRDQWEEVKSSIDPNSDITFTYAQLSNYIDYGKPFHFKTQKYYMYTTEIVPIDPPVDSPFADIMPLGLADQDYENKEPDYYLRNDFYYTCHTYPTNPSLVYYPNVTLPGEIKTSPTSDGKAQILIPYTGSTKYTITETGPGGTAYNYLSDNLETRDGYYILPSTYTAGSKVMLKVEYTGNSQCYISNTISIPDYKAYTVSTPAYPSSVDGYYIPTRGGNATLSFQIAGSLSSSASVDVYKNGSSYRTETVALSSDGAVSGYNYYRGNFTLSLPAGTYTVKVTGNGVTKEWANITLTEPDPVSFSASASIVSCNTSGLVSGNTNDGTITLSGIRGGAGSCSYKLNEGSPVAITGNQAIIPGCTAGTYTVTVSDSHSNSFTGSVKVEAPAPVTATTSASPPTLFCIADATVSVTASGGTGILLYSRENNNLLFGSSNALSGYSGGTASVYVQDGNRCIVSFPVTIPAPAALSVASKTVVPPTCHGETNGSCRLVVSNRAGPLTVSGLPSSSQTVINGDTITITGLEAGNCPFTITDTKNGKECKSEMAITIPEKAAVYLDATVTPVAGKGTATGKIEGNVSGGNGGTYKVYYMTNRATRCRNQLPRAAISSSILPVLPSMEAHSTPSGHPTRRAVTATHRLVFPLRQQSLF